MDLAFARGSPNKRLCFQRSVSGLTATRAERSECCLCGREGSFFVYAAPRRKLPPGLS
jgi:hypothetical protein